MSRISSVIIDIEEMIVEGHSLITIADSLQVPISWVQTVESNMYSNDLFLCEKSNELL